MDAAKEKQAADGGDVTIDVNATSSESVSMSSDSINDAEESGIGVNFSTQNGTMSFSAEALSGLIADGVTITSEIKEAEVPEAYKDQVPADTKVFSISLTAGDTAITQFGGTFSVKIAFEASGATDDLYVAYLAADGTFQKMDSYYEDGFMVFTTNHLSDYEVLEEFSSVFTDHTSLALTSMTIAALIIFLVMFSAMNSSQKRDDLKRA